MYGIISPDLITFTIEPIWIWLRTKKSYEFPLTLETVVPSMNTGSILTTGTNFPYSDLFQVILITSDSTPSLLTLNANL